MAKVAVCIVGDTGSGKTTVSYMLEEEGFRRISISDDIRKEFAQNRITINTRLQLIRFATELRNNHGNCYFLTKSLRENTQYEKIVIDAVRYMQEVHTCYKMGYRTYILAIDAPQDVRLSRVRMRKGIFDPATAGEFYEHSRIEMSTISPEAIQDVVQIMELADHTINNNNTITSLKRKVIDFLDHILLGAFEMSSTTIHRP